MAETHELAESNKIFVESEGPVDAGVLTHRIGLMAAWPLGYLLWYA
ncbi:hypothetical protein NRY66_01460 [Acidithiobacillus ferrooxidans]|nr:hypothetical protein [Acidithiobacillus ferrooxidans]